MQAGRKKSMKEGSWWLKRSLVLCPTRSLAYSFGKKGEN
jgi:hypothetical protein